MNASAVNMFILIRAVTGRIQLMTVMAVCVFREKTQRQCVCMCFILRL